MGDKYVRALQDTILELVPQLPSTILLGHTPYLQVVPNQPYWSDGLQSNVACDLTSSCLLYTSDAADDM
eukprot:932952-Karenia_brevis.AAC.1